MGTHLVVGALGGPPAGGAGAEAVAIAGAAAEPCFVVLGSVFEVKG